MRTPKQALAALERAIGYIEEECCDVLGSEQHYQAMVYHCLRLYGKVPLQQLAMNVKIKISNPTTEWFKQLDERKHPDYQGGFEPIPDVVLFSASINKDWRRRNNGNTAKNILMAVEIKASERKGNRLRAGEISKDMRKLHALREEVRALAGATVPMLAMLIIDSTPDEQEQMTFEGLEEVKREAVQLGVHLFYLSSRYEMQRVVPAATQAVPG